MLQLDVVATANQFIGRSGAVGCAFLFDVCSRCHRLLTFFALGCHGIF